MNMPAWSNRSFDPLPSQSFPSECQQGRRAWGRWAKTVVAVLVVGLAACAQTPQAPASSAANTRVAADWVLLGGKVVTVDGRDSVHQAVAVQGDRIMAVGSDAEMRAWAGANTRVVDLAGRTVIPGLIDSHIHAIRAALSYATDVHWFGAPTLADALGRLRAAAQKAKPGDWLIVAGGWTEEQFAEKRRPTQAELMAAAPGHPVYVQWMYGWAMLTPEALARLNLRAESDLPGGGKFARDAQGRLTGAIEGGIVPLFDRLPQPDFAQKVAGTKAFFRELNRVGLTGILDPGGFNMSPAEYAPLQQVWRQRELSLRVRYSYFSQKRGSELDEFKELTQLLPMGFGDAWLRFNGIGERVTFSLYNNENPTPRDQESFYQAARWAAQNGYTLTQHWHMDQTVDKLLDVFERVDREFPIDKLRWSIAHLNNGSQKTFERMKALNVGWAVQHAMYFEGDRALRQRGLDALLRTPALATGMRVGVPMGAGTDAHRVANYNPFVALRWLLDGKTAAGTALRGAAETPTRLQALRMYSMGSAWFSHEDSVRGSIEAGKWADLVVLDTDYLTAPVERIGQTQSLLTMVGGRVVFAQGGYTSLEAR